SRPLPFRRPERVASWPLLASRRSEPARCSCATPGSVRGCAGRRPSPRRRARGARRPGAPSTSPSAPRASAAGSPSSLVGPSPLILRLVNGLFFLGLLGGHDTGVRAGLPELLD